MDTASDRRPRESREVSQEERRRQRRQAREQRQERQRVARRAVAESTRGLTVEGAAGGLDYSLLATRIFLEVHLKTLSCVLSENLGND